MKRVILLTADETRLWYASNTKRAEVLSEALLSGAESVMGVLPTFGLTELCETGNMTHTRYKAVING